MIIDLHRLHHRWGPTIGALYVGRRFECFSLEDPPQASKIKGRTRIPAGSYDIDLRSEGGMSPEYARRFPEFHEGMLWLRNVPQFKYVYFHIGNTALDTRGCILVGVTAQRDQLVSSTAAYSRFYPLVVDAARAGKLELRVHEDSCGG